LAYFNPGSTAEFVSDYRSAVEQNLCAIIEVNTDREENRRFHSALQDAIMSALSR